MEFVIRNRDTPLIIVVVVVVAVGGGSGAGDGDQYGKCGGANMSRIDECR